MSEDPWFGRTWYQLQEVMDARLYVGRCASQVWEFIQERGLPSVSGAAQGPIGHSRV